MFIGLAVLLMWLAYRSQDPKKLVSDLESADYRWVLLSMIIGYSALVSRGARWLILLEPMGYKPKLWNSIHSVSTLYIVNMAIPRAGEVGRCTSLNQVENIPVDKLFAFFAILFFVFRKRIIDHPKFEIVRNFWNGIKEGLKTIKTMKRKKAFIAHSIYIWLCYYLMVYLVFYALPETAVLTWTDAFFVMVAASLGIVVPVPGNGAGAYHYLVMLALSILGLSQDAGRTFGLIVHSSQTLMLLVAGATAFLFLYLERRKMLKNAAPPSPSK